jgi:hypothetical protein
MRMPFAIAGVMLLWPAILSATDTTNRGPGTTSCGSWTLEHRDRTTKATIQDSWLLGFVTAEELFSNQKRYKNPDNAALIVWVSDYCAKKPLSQLMEASYVLTVELRNGDPAALERFKEQMRPVYRRMCDTGDKEACKFLEQMR